MRGLLGAASDEFFAALVDPLGGLRVNTLRLSPERFWQIRPFPIAPLPYPAEGFRVEAGSGAGRHPYHAAGLYYLQDPGAMTVGALLAPQPGERILDLAAAPGGKTTHIAALMRGGGLLVANDVQPARTRELIGNLERCGVRNCIVTRESPRRLAEHFGAWFDRVLLDAPCSGEAMFYKSAAAGAGWSPAAVAGCARRQVELLAEAARLVRPGGRLVYSTCTFSPEEDEQAVARFLAAHGEFALIDLPSVPGAEPGRPDWAEPGAEAAALERTVRLWPHRVAGAGHFVAALRRRAGHDAPALRPAHPFLAPDAAELWHAFAGERLRGPLPGAGELVLRGTELYRLPLGAPELGRLRVERPGWWLGSVRRHRFEPAHALALGIPPARVTTTFDLSADAPETAAYLRGETLPSAGEPGWLQVTVAGFPLGWAKRVGATLKNHYPRGLRRFA